MVSLDSGRQGTENLTQRGPSAFSESGQTPLVSVIIPSRNSGRTITHSLRSITAQTYKTVEIIVVDCFSVDSTKQIAEKMGARVVSHGAERSVAKNLGAKLARGEYLYFMDADYQAATNVIATCVKALDYADGVLISNRDAAANSTVSRLIGSRREILSHTPLNVAVRFVKKEAFDRVGGFDPELFVGEDLDFHRRFIQHGFKVERSSAKEWHLGSPLDLKGLARRSLYYSKNQLRYASKNPSTALRRLNPFQEITAWRNSDAPGSDLMPVVLLGFLSNVLLMVGILLSLRTRRPQHDYPSNATWNEDGRTTTRMSLSKKTVMNNYDREGRDYDTIRYGRTRGGNFFSEIELSKTTRMMKRGNVLHIGTATGRLSSHLVAGGFDYVGLEISAAMARITKERLKSKAEVVRGDAEHLPFKAASFDNLLCVRSFHFLPYPQKFLLDARLVMKAGGRLIVSFEKKVQGREAIRRILNLPASKAPRVYYTNRQVARMMRKAELNTLLVGNVTRLPLLFYWKTSNDSVLRRIHSRIPSFFGTVGLVVGTRRLVGAVSRDEKRDLASCP